MTAAGERVPCRLDDLPDGEARGFSAAPAGHTGLFAARRGGGVRVFLDGCPHPGLPPDAVPGRFLDAAGGPVACGVRGALFAVRDATASPVRAAATRRMRCRRRRARGSAPGRRGGAAFATRDRRGAMVP